MAIAVPGAFACRVKATLDADVWMVSSERFVSVPVQTAMLRTPCHVARVFVIASKGFGALFVRRLVHVQLWVQNLAIRWMEPAVAVKVGKV